MNTRPSSAGKREFTTRNSVHLAFTSLGFGSAQLVSQQVKAAVATGENLNSVADFYPLIANGAVDVLDVAARHSDITGCRQIAHMAHLHGLPVTMMNAQAEFMAHAAAALPNHVGMEVVDPGRE